MAKKEEKKSRLEELKEVGADLNTKLKLKPKIDLDGDSAKDLKAAIEAEMAQGGGQLYDTDQNMLEPQTWEYLTDTLGIEPKAAPGDGDAVDPEEAVPEKKAKPKAEKKEKEEKAAAKPKAEKEDKPKSKVADKPAFTRIDASVTAVNELCKKKDGASMKDIMTRSNEIYVKKGGESVDIKNTTTVHSHSVKTMIALELLEQLDSGNYKTKK